MLSFWCFYPGFALQDMLRHGVRSIILTSGTLAPLATIARETGVELPIQLENPHIIESHQLCVAIVPSGPSGAPLNSSFKMRDNPRYLNELGEVVGAYRSGCAPWPSCGIAPEPLRAPMAPVHIARIVPDGLLVFFPSYGAMTACITHWKKPPGLSDPSIWDRLARSKRPLVEPRSKAALDSVRERAAEAVVRPTVERSDGFRAHALQVISEYRSAVAGAARTGTAAVLLAVCRGKISEGLDFSDQYGRAVIITGLPYPAIQDPKVKLKRMHMDECYQRASAGQVWSAAPWPWAVGTVHGPTMSGTVGCHSCHG